MMRHCLILVVALAAVGGVTYLAWPDPPTSPAPHARPRARVDRMAVVGEMERADAAAPAKPRVMLLGASAFAPSAADAARQVADVVEGLEPFRPTRVLVERPAAKGDDVEAEYKAFAAGGPAPAGSPERLIGFAVARRLGHDRVYGFGGPADDEPAGLQQGSRTVSRRGRRAVMDPNGVRALTMSEPGVPALALRDHLLTANDPAAVRQRYGAELATAADGDPAGWLAGEHRRRLRMFAAVRAAAIAGERVLAVVGAGPLGVLRLCAEGCSDVELIEVAPYLGVTAPTQAIQLARPDVQQM